MFEEEEQEQSVPGLKAALEEALAAAEAEGRSRQSGVHKAALPACAQHTMCMLSLARFPLLPGQPRSASFLACLVSRFQGSLSKPVCESGPSHSN